jgi:hypothetical protein
MKCVLVLVAIIGCERPEASTAAKEQAADATYAAEHLRCVADFHSDPEIDACRARVRARWGIVETTRKDGGS